MFTAVCHLILPSLAPNQMLFWLKGFCKLFLYRIFHRNDSIFEVPTRGRPNSINKYDQIRVGNQSHFFKNHHERETYNHSSVKSILSLTGRVMSGLTYARSTILSSFPNFTCSSGVLTSSNYITFLNQSKLCERFKMWF